MFNKLVILAFLVSVSGVAQAMPQNVDQMVSAAENIIVAAASHGQKSAYIPFGYANVSEVEMVADNLRARGYVIDEEAMVINPEALTVRYFKTK